MIRDVLGASASVTPALLALVFFVSFFLGVVLWTYRRGARQAYVAASWMPLEGAVAIGEEGDDGASR